MAKDKTEYKKGMSKEDIFKELEGFETNSGKIGYLKKITEKEELLDEETKNAVYARLGNLSFKKIYWGNRGCNNPSLAVESYEKLGLKKKAEEIKEKVKDHIKRGNESLKFYHERGEDPGDLGSAVLHYRMAGDKEGIAEIAKIDLRRGDLMNAGGEFLDAGFLEWAKDVARLQVERGNVEKAIYIYEELGDKVEIQKIAERTRPRYSR